MVVVVQVDVAVGGVHHGEWLPLSQEDTLPLPDPRHPHNSKQRRLLITSLNGSVFETKKYRDNFLGPLFIFCESKLSKFIFVWPLTLRFNSILQYNELCSPLESVNRVQEYHSL